MLPVARLAMAAFVACTLGQAVAGDGPAAVSAASPAPLYFSSVEDAVKSGSVLLAARDWAQLSRYYDLSVTPGVLRAQLVDGSFFLDPAKSPTGPGALTRWHNPFTPGARFTGAKALGDPLQMPCIWSVSTVLSIDQGGGGLQRAVKEFRLIQTVDGFQFLPPAPTGAHS